MPLQYTKHQNLKMKDHLEFDEAWLQERIAQDTSILGLGDGLEVIERERRQQNKGRLDLLLFDPEEKTRYEVELMLGDLDESHIIRCIEYWDIENRRYPGYDHCAVIVAENITRRFLNVLGLLAGNIPLIAIQLNALEIDGKIVLDFVKVMDRTTMRIDDEMESSIANPTDREYWKSRDPSGEIMKMMDELILMINTGTKRSVQPRFTKYYIGLTEGHRPNNFLQFRPNKKLLTLNVKVNDALMWKQKFESTELSCGIDADESLWIQIKPKEFDGNKTLLAEIISEATRQNQ